MTVQQIISNITDESANMVTLISENGIYRRMYQLLLERCEELQLENERIINRIIKVKKIKKRYKRDIKLLVERLDNHGDLFRTSSVEMDVKPFANARTSRLVSKAQPILRNIDKQVVNGVKKLATKRKNKNDKPERDPNAPKKPCNAFFQFCQEQRPLVVAETTTEMGAEPTKQEITRQLASRWRALSLDEKRVYVAMFERSKEKYVEEMSAYVKKEQ